MWLTILLLTIATASAVDAQENKPWMRQERRYNEDDSDVLNAVLDDGHLDNAIPETDVDVVLTGEGGGSDDGSKRGLVPQLWPNYTAPTEPPAAEVKCAAAHLACAYRTGCGLALQSYGVACHSLIASTVNASSKTEVTAASTASRSCTTHCKHSLIALLSTKEGARLMEVRETSS